MSSFVAPARRAFATAARAHTTVSRAAPSTLVSGAAASGIKSHLRATASPVSSSFCTASLPPRRTPVAKATSLSRSLSTSVVRRDDPAQSKGTPIGQIEQRLSLTFTCAVADCGHRSTHEFSKRSYERGIVLVQCPGCKNRHLIADHLSWFTESPSEPKTVEEMVREKGGRIRTGRKIVEGGEGEDQGETIEILTDSDAEEFEVQDQEGTGGGKLP